MNTLHRPKKTWSKPMLDVATASFNATKRLLANRKWETKSATNSLFSTDSLFLNEFSFHDSLPRRFSSPRCPHFLLFHWIGNEIVFFFRALIYWARLFLVSRHLQQHLRWMDFFSNARMRACALLRLLNSKNVRSNRKQSD